MKYTLALAALGTAVAASENPLLARQTDNTEQYIQEICFPNTTSPVPPCQAIINIESACQPNGTAALDYSAHQQCMCNGGYFNNWRGCLNCQYVHGTRSEAVAEAFSAILSSASSQFCSTATPTAVFASYFSALSDSSPQTATGVATSVSDQYPSQSAVSLYYTATGNQGPGAITGSAAQATAVASSSGRASSSGSLAASAATSSRVSSSGSSSSAKQSSSSVKSSSGSQTGSSSVASSSSAAQTGAANAVVVSEGLLAVVAGAMLML
ncbi:hypothetical protein E4T50_09154 [Aureobasidium sp. EXF-12298]|nr:hypothetical protein E4T50_09154 [Aureobasidium sp. EXF-12298]KAI4756138.1 hypothetical protein E4T51_10758 [Aureobasidium sp. EXF-12344]KAI4776062.1 hypothetical protein E4T52_09020 [Aureobasidium sp. EXF-3400]